MAHYSTPFIIVNLGCEMLYVIDQRLKAQQIPTERASIVLTDITSILLNVQLLDDLFLPQPVPDHGVIMQLLQDISASSIMKLDEFSWNKLWDLMSVLFKWQMSVCLTDVFDITRRHLDGVHTLLENSPVKELCLATKRKFTTLHSKITANDMIALTGVLRDWFDPYCCKISVLMRLGLQKADASFTEMSSIDKKFLQSLGANIYNFDCKNVKENGANLTDTNEVSFYVKQFKQCSEKSDGGMVTLRLPFQLGTGFTKDVKIKKSTRCATIDTKIRKKPEDLVFCQEEDKSMQQQLLDMLE